MDQSVRKGSGNGPEPGQAGGLRKGSPIDALGPGRVGRHDAPVHHRAQDGTLLLQVCQGPGHDRRRARQAQSIELRKQLTAAVTDKRLITCGTGKTTTPGITPNHAYAVLGYDAKTDAIRLWNPHGDSFTPKGTPSLLNGDVRVEGRFSVPLSDFVQQFSGLAFETTEVVD